jgi:hypothetical protein
LVGLGLTETLNAAWAKTHPAHPLTASLLNEKYPEKNRIIETNHTTKSEKFQFLTKWGNTLFLSFSPFCKKVGFYHFLIILVA